MQPGQSRPRWAPAALVAAALIIGACGGDADLSPETAVAPADKLTTTSAVPHPPADEPSVSEPFEEVTASAAAPPPSWLGNRPLPLGPDGYGEIQATPPELTDRRLAPVDRLPPPPSAAFASTIGPVPGEVVERSTWDPACPVDLDDLRYLTVSFWGFDERPHTGELLVHAEVADEVVQVFRRLHEARFPIEEMRITRAEELDLHPTGDGNNTGSFVCRPSRGTTSWSEHAYGRSVDINPFHNPYLKGEVVLPELASAYADRSDERPGMIFAGDTVTSAFSDIGWGWGGTWRSSKDFMHFSVSGR